MPVNRPAFWSVRSGTHVQTIEVARLQLGVGGWMALLQLVCHRCPSRGRDLHELLTAVDTVCSAHILTLGRVDWCCVTGVCPARGQHGVSWGPQ